MSSNLAVILFEVLFLLIGIALVALQVFLIKRSTKALKARKGFGSFNYFGIASSSFVLIFFGVFIIIDLYFLLSGLLNYPR